MSNLVEMAIQTIRHSTMSDLIKIAKIEYPTNDTYIYISKRGKIKSYEKTYWDSPKPSDFGQSVNYLNFFQ